MKWTDHDTERLEWWGRCLRHTSEPCSEISRSGRTQLQFLSFNAHVNFPSPCVWIPSAKLYFLWQLATVESSIKWAVKLTDSLKYITPELVSKTKNWGVFFSSQRRINRNGNLNQRENRCWRTPRSWEENCWCLNSVNLFECLNSLVLWPACFSPDRVLNVSRPSTEQPRPPAPR